MRSSDINLPTNQRKESSMFEIKIVLFVVFILAVFMWQYLDDKKYNK